MSHDGEKSGLGKRVFRDVRLVSEEVFLEKIASQQARILQELRESGRQQQSAAINLFRKLVERISKKKSGANHPVCVCLDELKPRKEEVATRVVRDIDHAIAIVTEHRFRLIMVNKLDDSETRSRLTSPTSETGGGLGIHDAVVIEDKEVRVPLRVGLVECRGLLELDGKQPIGAYGRVFCRLAALADMDHECRTVSLHDALADARLSPHDHNSLNCLMGVFESPGRIESGLGHFCGHMHLVSLVGVTRRDSGIKTLQDVMTNPAAEIFCVENEVGHEFLTRVLCISQRASRLTVQKQRSIEEVLVHLHGKARHPRVAFLDGVSAVNYIQDTPGGSELEIRLRDVMKYPAGFLFKQSLPADILGKWDTLVRKARMDEWRTGREEEEIRRYVDAGVLQPVLYGSE